MAEPYNYTKFELRAVITTKSGDVLFEDVLSIGASFALNDPPTAVMTVATGYDARSNKTKKATIHDARKKIRPRDKVVVTLTIKSEAGQKEKMENGTFVIFDGFITGIAYQRSVSGANYRLHAVHWLDDLNNSSALNGDWSPGAPHDLSFNAACQVVEMTEPNSSGTSNINDLGQPVPAMDPTGQFINQENAGKDLWGEVIKPIFNNLAEWALPNNFTNTAAQNALKRMPGKGEPFYTPLALNLDGLPPNHTNEALRTALSVDMLQAFAYSTFWGKLIGEYAPQFFFSVSPGVEHALLIPFFGGLRWEEGRGKKIAADEYYTADFNANMSQLLEAIMVYWPWKSGNSAELGGFPGTTTVYAAPCGSWPKTEIDEDRPGLKLFKEPPGWIVNMTTFAGFSGATTCVKGPAGGDCLEPGTAAADAPGGWLTAAEIADKVQSSGVADRFAHHWYKTELLGQRYGELQGKLRFDIAPGSIVRIELPPQDIEDDNYMVAAVTGVSYLIDAEKMQAGTSFTLGYIRTLAEDQDTDITETFAPLYTESTAWFGGPLQIIEP